MPGLVRPVCHCVLCAGVEIVAALGSAMQSGLLAGVGIGDDDTVWTHIYVRVVQLGARCVHASTVSVTM